MPGFKVNGDTSLALAASLIDISRRVVEDTQHGHNSIGGTVGTANVRGRSPDVVNGDSNASGILGNDGTVLERVIDSINRVFLHGEQKARTHLWVLTSRIKEGGSGMGKVLAREHVVGFNGLFNVISVDSNGHAHQHHLWAFRDASVQLQEVGLFQSLESKVVVFKITGGDNGIVQAILVLHDGLVEFLGDQRGGFSGARVNVVVELLGEVRELVRGFLVQVAD
mmetsp:Transcript_75449/g.211528  ORF Transcript_75449/g.211528 Transcript_75449/m.211528 type:complete len:224 (+) Transcript_75449:1709-2380(+)